MAKKAAIGKISLTGGIVLVALTASYFVSRNIVQKKGYANSKFKAKFFGTKYVDPINYVLRDPKLNIADGSPVQKGDQFLKDDGTIGVASVNEIVITPKTT